MIRATTIDDAWRQALQLCWEKGIDYKIGRGSYEGEFRRQLEGVAIEIAFPETRPLAPILPPSCPFRPTDDELIEAYFLKYLFSDELELNEEYTYGQFIKPQLDKVISFLNVSEGRTNQAAITVGDTESVDLLDPPCLKVITFNMVHGALNMSVFFRSWDLVSGFPQNLGGLQLLKEYVVGNLLFDCVPGKTFAYSSGLHIYSQYFDLIRPLCTD
jgi:thymidylate synthase